MRALEIKKMMKASEKAVPHNALFYGPAKSGKTVAALALASHFKILYLDGEKGGDVMFGNLSDEQLANIEWVRFSDWRKSPVFIEALMRFFEGETIKVCETHGHLKCTTCMLDKAPVMELNIKDYPPEEWIIVTDSLTQATSSATYYVTSKQKVAEGEKFTFDEWRLQGYYLERVLSAIQAGTHNTITITHEQGILQEDDTEKLTPSGGTKNFARNVAKYFGTIVYFEVMAGKHMVYSSTTQKPKAITGSRTNIDVSKDGILALFKPELAKKAETPKALPNKPTPRPLNKPT